ncbi:MAG: single-stranded-DNA-specific exonuclease RecJ, partial [Duodenibacillus sp.]|nr:single-stranded-DNA-specific exonuclease RecJ [Duodenibacillus sp.]
LGTVADVVKLDHNNRILVGQGLSRIRRGRCCPGISALFAVARRDPALATARDFAFAIAPRINAAGRLTEMRVGIDCLLADTPAEAMRLAAELDLLNQDRRSREDDMQLDAAALISSMDWQSMSAVTLFDPDWHQGLVGLVASRVKERINRPVIAFAYDDSEEGEGMLKGSGRSIAGVHLKDALDRINALDDTLITRFGGHAMAAGMQIAEDKLPRFAALFDETVREMAGAEAFERMVYVDGALSPDEVSLELIESINERIWGQGFERPLFANDFRVVAQRVLHDAHLKLTLELGGLRFDAIFFRRNTPLPLRVRLAYRPEINDYQGRRSVQLVVEAAEVGAD